MMPRPPSRGRVEDDRLLRGLGQYIDDILLNDVVEATFVRSEHAHAVLAGVDLRGVDLVDGVLLTACAHDVDVPNALPVVNEHPGLHAAVGPPILADDRVRYIGEPIALVIAENRYLAEDAAEQVSIDYEPLNVCVDARLATERVAPLLHEVAVGNVCGSFEQRVGDADLAIAAATNRERLELYIHRGSAQPMETRGVLAHWDGARLTVWSNTQRPHGLRRVLGEYLSLPLDSIRVASPDTGGAFGAKAYYTNEELLVAWAAVRLGRPVKWIEDRTEHFLATYPEHGQHFCVEVGFDDCGTISGLKVDFLHDLGAYAPYGFAIAQNTANHLLGTYLIADVAISCRGIYTNKTPSASYRGAGRPQGNFVIERVMDHIAAVLHADRAVVRSANLIRPEAMPHDTGLRTPIGDLVYDSGDYPFTMSTALERIGYHSWPSEQSRLRADGRTVGLGLANYVECSVTKPWEAAEVSINEDGDVELRVGVSAQGQGHESSLGGLVASTLGVDLIDVVVRGGDTELIPDAIGTFGSRVAIMAGNAAATAAVQLRSHALVLAAPELGVAVEDLQWTAQGVFSSRHPQLGLSRKDLAAVAVGRGERLAVHARFQSETMHVANGTHAAVIEIDGETAAVQVLRYVVVHDVGTVLDERIVEGQVIGGLLQGIGGSLLESLVYDSAGQLLTGSFMDYLLPTIRETPAELSVLHLHSASPANPLGIKGAGEGGVIPVYAVIASAVENATGRTVRDVPLTPASIERYVHGDSQ